MNEEKQTDDFRQKVMEQFQSMTEELKEIKIALIGNGMGTTGIIPRLKDVEKRQERTEKLFFVGTGIFLAVGGLYTVARDFFFK